MTLRGFEEALLRMGVKKNKVEKVLQCFRFMDRGGEGSISWCEFMIVNDLW